MVGHEPNPDDDRLEPLVIALRQILKTGGLPLTPNRAPDVLLALDSVTARSVRPEDHLARVDALDRLLHTELKRLARVDLRPGATALFGIGRSHGTLTDRRATAADRLGFSAEHFRKRIEPKILDQLAWHLHQDSLQYVQRPDDGLPFAASGDTPVILPEHIQHAGTAEREAMTSEIWSRVYGLRAALIRRESTADEPERTREHAEHEKAARRRLGELLLILDEFLKTYGDEIFHGAAAHNAEGLIRLAGWTGEITAEEAREVRWEAARG